MLLLVCCSTLSPFDRLAIVSQPYTSDVTPALCAKAKSLAHLLKTRVTSKYGSMLLRLCGNVESGSLVEALQENATSI